MDVLNENIILQFVIDFYFDDDDDEDHKESLAKVSNYAETVVPRYTDRQFQSHFRMSPMTFENTLTKLHMLNDYNHYERAGGNPEILLEKQLMITLWYLANIESYRGVADRFGVSTSTTWQCVQKICNKLLRINNLHSIIRLPTNEAEYDRIINDFARKAGFPGIVGAIDGSHIPIKAPTQNSASYINRKGFHSILLQGICDSKKKFLDCYTGEVGSVHDACMFRRSDIGQRLNNLQFPQNGHLIGDSAYPLSTNMLVPFKDNGHLGGIQRNFNTKHSQSRVVIEQTFALLKGRFRRLKLLETVRPDITVLTIMSACILHNICLEADDVPVNINLEAELEEERLMNPANMVFINERGNNQLAIAKRNNIANLLYRRIL